MLTLITGNSALASAPGKSWFVDGDDTAGCWLLFCQARITENALDQETEKPGRHRAQRNKPKRGDVGQRAFGARRTAVAIVRVAGRGLGEGIT